MRRPRPRPPFAALSKGTGHLCDPLLEYVPSPRQPARSTSTLHTQDLSLLHQTPHIVSDRDLDIAVSLSRAKFRQDLQSRESGATCEFVLSELLPCDMGNDSFGCRILDCYADKDWLVEGSLQRGVQFVLFGGG